MPFVTRFSWEEPARITRFFHKEIPQELNGQSALTQNAAVGCAWLTNSSAGSAMGEISPSSSSTGNGMAWTLSISVGARGAMCGLAPCHVGSSRVTADYSDKFSGVIRAKPDGLKISLGKETGQGSVHDAFAG